MTDRIRPGAPGALRDAFLDALDAGDRKMACELAAYLGGSPNALPSATCTLLGLPPRSTYACAAARVLAPSFTLGPAVAPLDVTPSDARAVGDAPSASRVTATASPAGIASPDARPPNASRPPAFA